MLCDVQFSNVFFFLETFGQRGWEIGNIIRFASNYRNKPFKRRLNARLCTSWPGSNTGADGVSIFPLCSGPHSYLVRQFEYLSSLLSSDQWRHYQQLEKRYVRVMMILMKKISLCRDNPQNLWHSNTDKTRFIYLFSLIRWCSIYKLDRTLNALCPISTW